MMNEDVQLIYEAYERHNLQRVVSNIYHMADQGHWEGVDFYLNAIHEENPETLVDVGYAVRTIKEWDDDKIERIIDIINKIDLGI